MPGLLLAFFGTYFTVYGQEIALDPVTVTSSLVEKRASESGRNIAVIKGEYFQNLPVNSLDELLRYVPGVEMQARGPMGAQSDLVLRGGTFQQVLVILDGIRLNDPNTGHFNSYIPIAASEVDRIEVLKGASSAIYGSDAVGGVIHVITKTFAAKVGQEVSGQTRIDAAATTGAYGLRNLNAGTWVRRANLAVAGGIVSNNADGVQQRGTKGYFNANTVSASLNYALSPEWNIAVRSSFDHRDFAAQNFYTTFVSDTASERVKTLWNQIRIGYQKGKSVFSFDGGYKFVQDQYLYNSVSIRNNSKSQLWQGLATWKQSFAPDAILVAGFNYQNRTISSNDRGDHSLHQLAPFISFSKQLGSYFFINPSVRADWRERIGTELVPQITLSFKRAGWQVRGSAGKTIRDADFTERYNNYNKPLVTGGSIGNPDLKAERSFSYELGADWFWKTALKVSATAFRREHSGLIDYISTSYADMPRKENLSPTGTFALAKNIASVTTSGLEMDFQYSHTLNDRQKLWFNAGLTWLDTESSDKAPSFYVSSHARLLTNWAVLYQVGRFSMSINGLYKVRATREATAIDAEITRSYSVWNAKVGYALVNPSLSLFLQADNIIDIHYSDLLGAQMPGRWIMGGLRYVWSK